MKFFKKFKSKKEEDELVSLCKLYISFPKNADGYWLTETEIQLYEELEKHLKRLKVVK